MSLIQLLKFKTWETRGGSECFPFLSPFEPFEKLLKPFPVVDYSFPGKGKDLSPFEKLLKPFPVANLSWERKGPFPVETFLGKERTFPS